MSEQSIEIEPTSTNRVKLPRKKKLFIFTKYLLIFLTVPIIGTLLHEVGHYLVAIGFGCDSVIHYSFCTYGCDYYNPVQSIIITMGGPIATWLQSLIPFSFLVFHYKKEERKEFKNDLPPLFVILLCFATFCSRFIFNAVGGFFRGFQGDEGKISRFYGLYPGTIILISAAIALLILFYLLYMIPKQFRFTLIFGAVAGAILGYYLWYYQLGELLLP